MYKSLARHIREVHGGNKTAFGLTVVPPASLRQVSRWLEDGDYFIQNGHLCQQKRKVKK